MFSKLPFFRPSRKQLLARIQSMDAALDAARLRHNETIAERDELAKALNGARREAETREMLRRNATEADLRGRLAEARREPLVLAPGTPEQLRQAEAVVYERRGDVTLFNALFMLIDQRALQEWSSGAAVDIAESEARWRAGAGSAYQMVKIMLSSLLAEKKK